MLWTPSSWTWTIRRSLTNLMSRVSGSQIFGRGGSCKAGPRPCAPAKNILERSPLTTSGVRRTSPPQAVQKIRDGVFLVLVSITESPSADWRRLFYDAQQEFRRISRRARWKSPEHSCASRPIPQRSNKKLLCSTAGWTAPARKKQAWADARKCSGKRRKSSSANPRVGRMECSLGKTVKRASVLWPRQPSKIITNFSEFRAKPR